ncbi:HTH_Tnp_Tc3_2 domain-containing protein [Trichonephila clavipes]|nr:HTH_Tnp_Tc3_2 domain-containing protein [Trichonephila clavipes]
MRELANRCDSKIDEASIIQYVINGIDGPRSYKIILYGATSFSEFKQKLRIYETVIKNMWIHNSNSPNFRHSYESRGRDFKQQSFQRKPTKFNASDAAKNPQRCFNCNDIGHIFKSCPDHSRGPRCLSEVSEEREIAHSVISWLWQRFKDDGNGSRCYSTGYPRVTTPNENRYLAVTAKRKRRSTALDLSRQLFSATSTTVSRQIVYRRLGHIGLYARRPVRCVPLTATPCRLRLTWSREHALWAPQQWSCVMFSDEYKFSLHSD